MEFGRLPQMFELFPNTIQVRLRKFTNEIHALELRRPELNICEKL